MKVPASSGTPSVGVVGAEPDLRTSATWKKPDDGGGLVHRTVSTERCAAQRKVLRSEARQRETRATTVCAHVTNGSGCKVGSAGAGPSE